MGERSIWIDCDVIQADGGTRTASITGSFIALADAFAVLKKRELIKRQPLTDFLAAVSVGKVGGEILVDLAYTEDVAAEVDMNLVMTGRGRFVEVQGTAERTPFAAVENAISMPAGRSSASPTGMRIDTVAAALKSIVDMRKSPAANVHG